MKTLLLTLALSVAVTSSWAAEPSQAEAAAIAASIAAYPGKCACPYSIKANGSKCGKASAYSKPGGAVVLCFPADVIATAPKN